MAPSAEDPAPANTPNGLDTSGTNQFSTGPKPPPDVILPPKDIRAIVEKTAGYVARNGVVFEERIRSKEISNPKFSFLNEADAYAPFYQWRLDEIRAGRGTAVSSGREGEAPGASAAAMAAQKARDDEERRRKEGPEPPPDFQYSARMPNISAQDLDVVKLTASFVAKNGRSFMTALSQRESGNYQFDFLRPQHSLYQFFSRLVDQYTEILNAPRGVQEDFEDRKREEQRTVELNKNINNKYHILERSKRRAEYVKFQETQKVRNEEEAEQEKIAYAQVDWHDFVVVETVLFDEADDQAELPSPTSLSDLQSASLEQKAAMRVAPSSMRIEEAMPGEVDTSNYNDGFQQHYDQQAPSRASGASPFAVNGKSAYATPPPASNMMPPPPAISPQPAAATSANAQPPVPEIDRLASPPQPQQPQNPNAAPMNIRTDYTPRAMRKNQVGPTTLCPRCNQQIPVAQFDEHIRIEMLDPRWKEQRAKNDARYSTTNLSTADVANNLKRLASQRTDVFDGATGEYITEEEKERRKRAATRYDGRIPGVDGHGPKGNQSFGVPGLQPGMPNPYPNKPIAPENENSNGIWSQQGAPAGTYGGWNQGGHPGSYSAGYPGGQGTYPGSAAAGGHVGWGAAQQHKAQAAQSASIEEQIKHIREKAKQ